VVSPLPRSSVMCVEPPLTSFRLVANESHLAGFGRVHLPPSCSGPALGLRFGTSNAPISTTATTNAATRGPTWVLEIHK
jgi:hypothetical protein